jgi:hypothetical protein
LLNAVRYSNGPADCKSAIRQITNLRYGRGTTQHSQMRLRISPEAAGLFKNELSGMRKAE